MVNFPRRAKLLTELIALCRRLFRQRVGELQVLLKLRTIGRSGEGRRARNVEQPPQRIERISDQLPKGVAVENDSLGRPPAAELFCLHKVVQLFFERSSRGRRSETATSIVLFRAELGVIMIVVVVIMIRRR